ncbi:MAG TPA: adenine deaminase C-terminal domain-containing protein [Candidatus Limnocylindria bacterium]|nr:adenine deaminase C-terminal domain-containing protein [Candidatus Limnocylindria bacterium]
MIDPGDGVGELKHRIDVAMGDAPADLVLRGADVVNVYTGRTVRADIAIAGRRIVAVRPDLEARGARVIDCRGLIAGPGFVEPHMHLETTFVTPRQFARAIVPLGTTTLFADATDSSYVKGTAAVRALAAATRELPMRVFLAAPSYSAYLPGLQTVGGDVDLAAVEEMLAWSETASVGEVVAARVLAKDEEYLAKTLAARRARKRLNGHSMNDRPDFLDAFVAAGVIDDHTAASGAGLEERLARGVTLFLVEAPGRRELADMLKYVVEKRLPTRSLCLSTDNTSILEVAQDGLGYLDHAVRLAVGAGIDPVEAIQMASLNASVYYGKDGDIGSVTPGRLADIQLWDDLETFRPRLVFFGGELVAEDGVMTKELPPSAFPGWYRDTVRPRLDSIPERMLLEAGAGRGEVRVRVIHLPNPQAQATNEERIATLSVRHGRVWPSPEEDIVCFSVVERYRGTGNIGHGFLSGSGLQRGALATSLSISDSNIVVMGCDPVSMHTAVKALADMHGGFVVALDDRVLASIAAPVGGQMSDEPFEDVVAGFRGLSEAASRLGCRLQSPFLTMASTVLMSVPALGLSDCGYIDARTGRAVPTLV